MKNILSLFTLVVAILTFSACNKCCKTCKVDDSQVEAACTTENSEMCTDSGCKLEEVVVIEEEPTKEV